MSEGVIEEVHMYIFQSSVAKGSSQAPSPCRSDTSAQELREGKPLAEIRICMMHLIYLRATVIFIGKMVFIHGVYFFIDVIFAKHNFICIYREKIQN